MKVCGTLFLENRTIDGQYLANVIAFLALAIAYLSFRHARATERKASELQKASLALQENEFAGRVRTAMQELAYLLSKSKSTLDRNDRLNQEAKIVLKRARKLTGNIAELDELEVSVEEVTNSNARFIEQITSGEKTLDEGWRVEEFTSHFEANVQRWSGKVRVIIETLDRQHTNVTAWLKELEEKVESLE